MESSNQNKNNPRRPTVVFFYIVVGEKTHGRLHVDRTKVYTNK